MKQRVLIVDDLQFMRIALKEIIQEGGFTLAGEAGDGIEAISQYKSLVPDLVLMDITMPRMDGIECLRRLKKLDPKAEVIMCSSLGQEKYILQSIRYGAGDFIIKPFTKERVINALNLAMRRRNTFHG
jgi:two-component system chemotaxis response regulator CheY